MPLNFVAKAAITVALTAANYALQASRKIEGPRLEELGASVGDYGVPIPDIFGTRRVNPPVFWAEDLREVKRRRKTKGGKFNEYTYYGTWAVACAAHEIAGISRIWFDTHLVYDMTGAGPISPFDLGAGVEIGDVIAVYLGTMAQTPDERMAATVEAEHGAGSCPAYHGIAYIVFKDLPLEKLGNRIPQVSVEVVTNDTGLWPLDIVDFNGDVSTAASLTFSPDFSFSATGSFSDLALIDTASRTAMIVSTLSYNHGATANTVAVSNDGEIYGLSSDGDLYVSGPDGLATLVATGALPPGYYSAVWGLTDGDGVFHTGVSGGVNGKYIFDGVNGDLDDAISTVDDIGVNGYFTDLDGSIWCCGALNPPGIAVPITTAFFYRLTGGAGTDYLEVTGLPSASDSGAAGAVHYRDATADHFVFYWDGNLYAADRDTGTVTFTYSPGTLTSPSFRHTYPGVSTIWAGGREINLADLTLVRSVNASQWGLTPASPLFGSIYVPSLNALAVHDGDSVWFLYLDRFSGDGVTLGTIAANRAVKVGVEDYDFTTLDQVIPGWSVTQGQASSQLEPLFDAYDSDILPHEFEIIGKKRAGVSASTLLTENFVANEPRYTARVRQAAELPFALTYNFADLNADQQPNNVRVARPQDATAGRDERSIDMTTLANDADGMRGLAERHFRRMHGERREFDLGLTTWQLALEPGDVHTLDLDGDQLSARLLKTTITPAGTIQTEWKYDHASFAVLSGANGAEMDGRPVTTITVPVLSKGFFLDTPYLTDSDARTPPSIYIAAAPYMVGAWPGAVAFQAVDGEYTDEIGAVTSSAAATWGYANDTLPDRNPWLWDRLSEINITVQYGTLTGCTEAQIDADPSLNLALIGDELVNFTTATLEIDGTYTLSGFKRGRRGTEWACATHGARDVFLLMDTAQTVNMGLSEVDTDLSFKMITSGRSSAFPEDMEPFNGASLMPYAPCHLTAELDGSDWVFTWVRRTRVGGAWTGGAVIPLSEASESYQLYLGDGVTSVTKTVSAATTYTWTAAQQTTDTGSGVTSGELTFSMAQVSATVGAGFVAVY